MKVGSLFSGVGGFDLGLELAGMEVVWQVENDEQAQSILRRSWRDVDQHGDVRDVGAGIPRVDLICGGFPCQDLSVAGNRAGLDGGRSGLWHEFHRIIATLTPRWVLIENVPGLLTSNGGRDMGILVHGLAELGYGWAYRVIDSRYAGVPQRRRRVFIVGHLGDARPAFRALFPVCTGLPGDPPAGRATRAPTAAGAQGGARGPTRGLTYSLRRDAARDGVAKTPSADAEGKIRLRDPGFTIEVETAPTLDSRPHTVIPHPDQAVRDMRGNGDGATVNTLTGDHLNRPTDYTPVVYRKAQKAHDPEDCERWEEDEEANTLSSHSPTADHVIVGPLTKRTGSTGPDVADAQAGHIVEEDPTAYRCTDYGKLRYEETEEAGPLTGNPDRTRTGAIVMATGQGGAEISEDAPTLNCNHEQPIVVNFERGLAPHGSMEADTVAPALSESEAKGQTLASVPGSVPRRLTPLECERLQGFPDRWTALGVDGEGEDVDVADSPRYRMMGNAVTVPVAHWLGWRILEVDKEIR